MIKIWKYESDYFKCIQSFCCHSEPVYDILMNNNNQIVTCSKDQSIQTSDIETCETINSFASTQQIWCMAWWKQAQCLLEAGCDLSSSSVSIIIRKWNQNDYTHVDHGKIIKTLAGHKDDIRTLLVDESKDELLSCSDDSTIILWNLNTGQIIRQFKCDDLVLAICKIYKMVFVGASEQNLTFWNIETGQCKTSTVHTDWIWSLCYSARNHVPGLPGSYDSAAIK